MASGYCLDSDVLIWQLRNSGKKATITAFIESLSEAAQLGCSALSVAEIEQGMRLGEEKRTRGLLDVLECLPVDRTVAERGGAIVRQLKAQGFTIHLADALIAATCLVHDLTLVTLNVKDFQNVPGLKIESVP